MTLHFDDSDTVQRWRVVDISSAWQPTWINAPERDSLRVYPPPGTCDAAVTIAGDILRLRIRYRASRFVVVLMAFLIPSIAGTAFYLLPDNDQRITVAFAALGCGIATTALIYSLLRSHEERGDYLEIDRFHKVIRLPRQKLAFPFSNVAGFQWISGSTASDGTVNNVDLNLLANESGRTIRYHVIGNPTRSIAKEILAFSEFTLDEINLGCSGDRNMDSNST